MKPLTEIMQLIDTHSDVMPEGDYLRMCGLLKEVYDQMSKPSKEVEGLRGSNNILACLPH